jgi:hypothetical protein
MNLCLVLKPMRLQTYMRHFFTPAFTHFSYQTSSRSGLGVTVGHQLLGLSVAFEQNHLPQRTRNHEDYLLYQVMYYSCVFFFLIYSFFIQIPLQKYYFRKGFCARPKRPDPVISIHDLRWRRSTNTTVIPTAEPPTSSHSAPLPLPSLAATCWRENFRSNDADAEHNRYSMEVQYGFALSILIHAAPLPSLWDRGDLSHPHVNMVFFFFGMVALTCAGHRMTRPARLP